MEDEDASGRGDCQRAQERANGESFHSLASSTNGCLGIAATANDQNLHLGSLAGLQVYTQFYSLQLREAE